MRRNDAGTALAAAALTLGVFLLLPFLETLSAAPGRLRILTDVDALRRPVEAPPAPPPVTAPTVPVSETRPLPKPRLQQARPELIPIHASLSLALSLGDVGGDFDFDFPLAPQALAVPADAVFSVDDVDHAPQPLARLHPLYPYHARVKGLEGSVVVEFIVGPDGIPRDVQVVASQPADRFDAAACQAIRRWRFKPGTRTGQPVHTRMRQRVTFRLE